MEGLEASSCIKPSLVKGQAWAFIRSTFMNGNKNHSIVPATSEDQTAKWTGQLSSPPRPPPPPPLPPVFTGFVDTVARIVNDKETYKPTNAQPTQLQGSSGLASSSTKAKDNRNLRKTLPFTGFVDTAARIMIDKEQYKSVNSQSTPLQGNSVLANSISTDTSYSCKPIPFEELMVKTPKPAADRLVSPRPPPVFTGFVDAAARVMMDKEKYRSVNSQSTPLQGSLGLADTNRPTENTNISPTQPSVFTGFVDTAARIMNDRPRSVNPQPTQLHGNSGPAKSTPTDTHKFGKFLPFEELMVKTLKADSDCLISPKRAFDFGPKTGSPKSNRVKTKKTSRHLPPRTPEREVPVQPDQLQTSHKTHFANTGEYLFHLYEHDQLTDVVVHCGNYTFSAHSVTLACHSPFFSNALPDSRTNADNHHHVTLSADVSPTVFHILLDYMYTGDLHIDPENMAELLSASLTLGMDSVKSRCQSEMDKLSPANVLVVWEMAERNGLHAIANKAIKIVANNFHIVVKSTAFSGLDFEHVYQLLSQEDLPVASEYEVGEAAITWLQHLKETRRPYIARILSCVRLSLLTSEELFNIVNNAEFIFLDEDVQNMFMKANWLATANKLHLPSGLKAALPQKRNISVSLSDSNKYMQTSMDFKTKDLQREQDATKNGTHQNQITFIDPTLDQEEPFSDSSVDSNEDTDKLIPPVSVKRLMLLGGYDPVGHEMDNKASETFTYNRASHSWMSYIDIPAPRAHHATVLLDDTIYVIGGSDPFMSSEGSLVPQSSVFAFTTTEGAWKQVASLCTPRTRHRACILHGNIFVIGGRDETGVLSSIERYDSDPDVWAKATSMTCPRLGAGVAAFQGQMVVAGGYGPSQKGHHCILNTVEFIDPKSGNCTMKSPLRLPRCHGNLVESGGSLYLCGGLQPSVQGDMKSTMSMASIDTYNLDTDTWSVLTDLKIPRHQVAAAAMDGKLYVVGGMSTKTGTTSNLMECFDIATNTWELDVKPLPRPLMGCDLLPVTLLF